MREYIDVLIGMINEYTEEKTDLTNLALFLSKENEVSAIKVLKILIQAIQYDKLKKKIDINRPVTIKTKTFFGDTEKHRENIISNLVENQLYLSKDLLEYIVTTEKVHFGFKTHGAYPIYEKMTRILYDINNPNSPFFKRRDVALKYLDIISLLFEEGLLDLKRKDYFHESMLDTLRKYEKIHPKDNEINSSIVRMWPYQKEKKQTYDKVIMKYLKKDVLFWGDIKEREAVNITNDDCHYMGNVVVPQLKEQKTLLK